MAFFFLIVLSIFIFGWFFAIQLSLHKTIYNENNTLFSKKSPGLMFVQSSGTHSNDAGGKPLAP